MPTKTTRSRAVPVAPINWTLKRLGLALLFLFPATSAWADITVKPQYEANEPIVATVTPTGVPAGALIRGSVQVTDASYEFAPAPNATTLRQQALILREMASKLPAENETDRAKLTTAATEIERTLEGDTYYVWAKQGKHTITASGMWVLTDTGTLGGKLLDFGLYSFTKDFVVGGDDPPPPPPPPPPVPGTKWGLILRETNNGQSPQLGNLLIQLREKFPGNQLVIHDPTSLPEGLRALTTSVTPPALVVIARQADGTDKLVKVVPLTATSSAADVEKELK